MLLCVLFLLLSLLGRQSIAEFEAATARPICVCNSDEAIGTLCCSHQNNTCYPSFEEAYITNGSSIALCETNFVLDKKVKIENLHDISLTGHENRTNITCTEHRDGGIQIISSSGIEIKNIRLINCGALYKSTSVDQQSERRFLKFTSSLHVTNSTALKIDNVSILNGNGTGLVLLNSYGTVSECDFQENKVKNASGGGGMYIELNASLNQQNNLTIQGCNFSDNQAVSVNKKRASYIHCNSRSKFNSFGRGGGLTVIFTGDIMGTVVKLTDVRIGNNQAVWGGGMYIHFCKKARHNQIQLTDVLFYENICELYGGGGIDIGFTLRQDLFNNTQTASNSINFRNCAFQYNRAFFGGGVAFYSTEADVELNNSVNFLNCSWERNVAYYGAALDIAPSLEATPVHGDQPKITFEGATFRKNTLIRSSPKDIRNKDILTMKRLGPGRGAFIVAGQTINFKDRVEFADNTGSAIYAVSSILNFTHGTNASFVNNTALNGGAISLIGYSAIKIHNNVTVSMANNSAALGGAIFHASNDKHDYLFSHNCFIQGDNTSGVLKFAGNTAGNDFDKEHDHSKGLHHGSDIYVTTLLPCMEYCAHSGQTPEKPSEIFNCIGSFQFDNEDEALSTSGAYFNVTNISEPISFIPGKRTEIPFLLLDDLNQAVHGVYRITTKDSLYIDDVHTYTSENVLVLGGKPGTTGNITITKVGPREFELPVEIVLEECPPFFRYNKNLTICTCAANEKSEHKNIHICNKTRFESEILHGYWVGYESTKDLTYGICPIKFCFNGQERDRFHKLPSNYKEVGSRVCGKTRSGVLCGQCKSRFCVHYHSPSFVCGSCTLCEHGVGWILYILSELVPLTLLFIVILTFNISFTSGYLNGFILFSQVFDSVFSIGKGFIYFPGPVYALNRAILVIYKLFNFDFFGDDILAFCLWKEAKTLHLMSFRFVTVLFAAILVVITVLLMKRCYSKRFLCFTKSASMIHGLSAFLVMVYTQCTNISFQLLNYSTISNLDNPLRRVLFYQGNIDLFSREHAPFAFLAILCLSTLTLIPPLFLISYPLCYRVAALLRLDNTTVSKVLGKMCPMSKLKPIFDSFQGCFKDNYRHFAGLYFVYRVGLLASVLTSDPTVTYAFTQVQLSLMLTIHCICWPYVKRIHNIIDALLFLNLSIINVITILNYNYGRDGSVYQSTINVSTYTQLLFIYAPFVCLVVFVAFSVVRFCLGKMRKTSSAELGNEDEMIMERLGSSDEEGEISNSYNKLSDTY